MKQRVFITEGHLIDTGILSNILNSILREGADYRITRFTVGKTPDQMSSLQITVSAPDEDLLQRTADVLTDLGVYETEVPEAVLKPAPQDGAAPEDFYSTTNHRTEIFYQGAWHEVRKQRMDAVPVWNGSAFTCTKLRDIRSDDLIVCGSDSVRVFPPEARREENEAFAFMSNEVSSERSGRVAVTKTVAEMRRIRDADGKTVAVAGPVVIHTGGADALADLIRSGYIHGLLGGNAIAVHDLEYRFYGTSLGVDLNTGLVVEAGHNHHIRAINRIRTWGSIHAAIEGGDLNDGLMHAVDRTGIPCCLAGSIRDDGPLPETVTDMNEAQNRYAEILEGADLVIMLSTMLHAIGTGNMLPSHIPTVCIDINPAVVTKLADRGSGQVIGIVSDVGAFLRDLVRELEKEER